MGITRFLEIKVLHRLLQGRFLSGVKKKGRKTRASGLPPETETGEERRVCMLLAVVFHLFTVWAAKGSRLINGRRIRWLFSGEVAAASWAVYVQQIFFTEDAPLRSLCAWMTIYGASYSTAGFPTTLCTVVHRSLQYGTFLFLLFLLGCHLLCCFLFPRGLKKKKEKKGHSSSTKK